MLSVKYQLSQFSYLAVTFVVEWGWVALKTSGYDLNRLELGDILNVMLKYQLSQFSYLAVPFVVEWEPLKQSCDPQPRMRHIKFRIYSPCGIFKCGRETDGRQPVEDHKSPLYVQAR